MPTRIALSPTVRLKLRAVVRRPTAAHRDVLRARIILAAAAGERSATIASRLGCDDDTVHKWRIRFALDPTTRGLRDAPRSGRPATVKRDTRLELLKLACTPPPSTEARTHWTQAALRAALARSTGVSLSLSEIGRILRNGELRPHKFRLWLHSPDPEFRARAREVCRLYLEPPPGSTVVCVDEKTQMQALERRFPGRPPAPGSPGRYEFEYRRRGVLALIAAFDVRTGQILGQCRRQRKARDLVAFMEALARRYPRGPLYVIWDNLDIHKDGPDRRWTAFNARHGNRFRFVFTPKHASWLNQIEIWFSLLHRRVIRYGNFVDRADLHRKVEAFLRRWNRYEAHPFRWTFRGKFKHHLDLPHAEAVRRA